MRLTVLGGSAAAPNAGDACSGYLLETGQARIVLDLGPGAFAQLRRHSNYRTLSAIVVSHLHADHILDLLTLRNAFAYNPVPADCRVPLWLPPNGSHMLDQIAGVFAGNDSEATYFSDYFAINVYDPAETLSIADAILHFAPTVHYVPCWAIRVTHEKSSRCLAYTADTGPSAKLDRLIEGAQLLIAEATLRESNHEPFEERGHLTAAEAAQLAQRTGVETLVLTHTFDERGPDLLRQDAAAVFAGQIVVARSGTVIEW